MISERSKATRIMKELTGYFLEHKYYKFDVNFDLTTERFELTIKAPASEIPKHFDSLLEDLNIEREVEIDEYYNALLGGHGTDHDYTLLGKAVDSATVELIDGLLSLKVRRNINK